MSNEGRVRRSKRTRQRDVELNDMPPVPCERRGQEETSTRARSQDENPTLTTIDLDVYDDDVIITSPRAFAEAKNNSRRNHESTVVVDLDCEERLSYSMHTQFSTSETNRSIVINLEGSCYSMRNGRQNPRMSPRPPQPPPPSPPSPPKDPTFTCPVCMGPLVEETSTKCGHIFCKACIKASIAAQRKCPTCRRKISLRDIVRIYLPNTSSA